MEFTNRSAQPAPRTTPGVAPAPTSGGKSKATWKSSPMWLRVLWIVLLFAAAALAVLLVLSMYFSKSSEADYVDGDKQQAVFLANGQVYFSKINSINDQYLVLHDIYYLNVSQQVQPNQKDANGAQQASNVSLVKLGCELHGPVDEMIVNRDQVTFWENLKTNGQVSEAIKKWRDQNPQGQKCATPTDTTNPTNP